MQKSETPSLALLWLSLLVALYNINVDELIG
jgi:hypothetical protein